MKEILFRGKRLDIGVWEYGYYVSMYGDDCPRIYTGYNCYTLTPDWHRVDPKSIGQYTGKNDKYDKKIFEGDIIKTCGQHNCYDVIEYCDDLAGFYAVNDDIHIPAELAILKKDFIEVVGNVYDNMELIGGRYVRDTV